MRDLTQDYPAQRDALRAALTEAVEKLDRYGIYSDGDCIHEVSAKSYDGFIAHTNGGFRVLVPCDLRMVESEGLTDFESATLQSYIDQAYVDAAEAWIAERPDWSERWEDYRGDLDAYEWLTEQFGSIESDWAADTLREELWEVTDHWLTEGATFFYEITALFYAAGERRNNTGDDEVFIFAGINTDFEYGRDGHVEFAIERDYKLARLTPARIARIVSAMVDKV